MKSPGWLFQCYLLIVLQLQTCVLLAYWLGDSSHNWFYVTQPGYVHFSVLIFLPHFQNNYNIPKHRTQEDRCAAARLLLSCDSPCAVGVDSMLDSANLAYGASPERLYIIQESKIVYQGGPGPMSYRTREVRVWLENYASQKISYVG